MFPPAQRGASWRTLLKRAHGGAGGAHRRDEMSARRLWYASHSPCVFVSLRDLIDIPKRSWKLHLRLTLVISEPRRVVCIIISDLDCVLPLCPSPEVEPGVQMAAATAEASAN